MKRVVCIAPGRLELNEVSAPAPGPGEAVVRVRRVGVCGTDLHAFSGEQPYLSYPRVLGHELAGEVAEVGAAVTEVGVGDRVVVVPYLSCGTCIACRRGRENCCAAIAVLGVHRDGGMCERLRVPARNLIRTGELDWEQAALVECLSIGAHAVQRAAVERGERAVVVGCGPIGIGVVQLARAAGADVIAVDVDPRRLAFCRDDLDVAHTVDARGDAEAEVGALTAGDYATVVFDATGHAGSMRRSLDFVAASGRLVLVGLVRGDIAFAHPELHRRETTLICSRNATGADFAHVIDAVSDGRVRARAMITHRVGLDDVAAQLPTWVDRSSGVIKAMVEV